MESDLDKKGLIWAFLLGLVLTLFMPIVAPHWHLTYFAPFLIIAIYQKSLTVCIMLAISAGMILDMLAAYPTFGLHSATYSLSIITLYPQRRNVFADSLTTLPIMTTIFSSISCGFLALLLDLLDIANVFSWVGLFTDMILLPIADGILSFFLYILPAQFFGKRRRRGNDYFLAKKG